MAKSDTVVEASSRGSVVEEKFGLKGDQVNFDLIKKLVFAIGLIWSLFQLWVASPISYALGILVFDDTKVRYFHLFFAFAIAFLSYPVIKGLKRNLPLIIIDCILGIIACSAALYVYVFSDALATRIGDASQMDIVIAIIGILLLLEAARRVLGLPLVIIATFFILYAHFGPYMPGFLAHKGQSFSKIASHQWLTTEGVFGIAIGVSAGFVFLFVLMGALLERAGAGLYFIKLAFSLLGRLKGGPAKAAVLSSALTGMISGSSIANVVTTGSFTIPLMRKVGFSPEKAASIEVAASVNGQLTPPVMGAAAFLIVDYAGIGYTELMKYAILPALASYIALLYIVHLEAVKQDMPVMKVGAKVPANIRRMRLLASLISGVSLVILVFVISAIINFLSVKMPIILPYVVIAMVGLCYFALMKFVSGRRDLESFDNQEDVIDTKVDFWEILTSGLHYIIPIFVLVWCLMSKMSPGLSAFWACLTLVLVIMTQRVLILLLNSKYKETVSFQSVVSSLKVSFSDLLSGLEQGAKSMVSVAIATAAAGIVVGSITQTGVGNKMFEIVGFLAGDSVIRFLAVVALMSLLLGMGLPTTANYILVSSLMVGVMKTFMSQHGYDVPLVAIHLFVFYFGILADVTPPVGLAAMAGAALSGGKPIKTSLYSFIYSLRTIILPFMFIYDPSLILYGLSSGFQGYLQVAWAIFRTLLVMIILSSALQQLFILRNRLYETALLLIATIFIAFPRPLLDSLYSPFKAESPQNIVEILQNAKEGTVLRFEAEGEDEYGDFTKIRFITKTSTTETAEQKISSFGIKYDFDKQQIIDVKQNSPAQMLKLEIGYKITGIFVARDSISVKWAYGIGGVLILSVFGLQMARRYEKRHSKNQSEREEVALF